MNKNNSADKIEIMNLLNILQVGYIKRDLKAIDSFMEKLFDKNKDIIILGTSNDEWFFNFDEAKELFLSDWEWWGDVRFNIENTSVSSEGNIAWLRTTGTVKYEHDNTDATYERWFKSLSETYFGENSGNTDYSSLKENFFELNWLLHHMLHDWEKEKRTYLSPIRFTAVLEKSNNRWVFRQMQFSFPSPLYPDMRIDHRNIKMNTLEKTRDKLRSFKQIHTSTESGGIRQFLNQFQQAYLTNEKGLDSLIEEYFLINNDFCILGIDGDLVSGKENVKQLIKSHREVWDAVSIDIDEALIFQNDNVAWIISGGNINKNLKEETAIKQQVKEMKNMFSRDITPKQKLFEMRKHISMTLREIAKGDEYIWPFRFEAVLQKEETKWKFSYIQFSFPFYFILEGLRDEIEING